MNFLVVTFAPSILKQNILNSYGPYVKEMDLWFEGVDHVRICSPTKYSLGNLLLTAFRRTDLEVVELPEVSLVGFRNRIRTIFYTPLIMVRLFKSFLWADHIHFRSPGNITLLGLLVQIVFPFKKKTAKYAGNWGENKGQPWSYRFQKWILSNTFLTRNMRVLVYGDWPGQTNNVLPFFTASYSENEIIPVKQRELSGVIRLVFVGALMKSKNPLVAIQVAESLWRKGFSVQMEILGDGAERSALEKYIDEKGLQRIVFVRGNVQSHEVKAVLQESHFLVFLSNSEGWPKAVAEAMFWGCVPLTKPVSCVPWMLQNGKRGILANTMDADLLASELQALCISPARYNAMSEEAARWSRNYTLEKFQKAIQSQL